VVIGDRDGVVVVAAEKARTVLESARRRAGKEADFRKAIRQGRSTVELLGLEAAIQRLVPS
jgi:4-hydroxy-4-methyl-2-oxoglutarate aldolase